MFKMLIINLAIMISSKPLISNQPIMLQTDCSKTRVQTTWPRYVCSDLNCDIGRPSITLAVVGLAELVHE